jgi:CBS domain-containing protein
MSEFDLPVASFMTAPVHTLRNTTTLTRAAQALDELGISALPIVDHNGHMLGVLERADLLRAGRIRHRPIHGESHFWWPDAPVEECMQTSVPVMAPSQSLRLCARRMLERGLHRVYVVADWALDGVVSTREMLTAVVRAELETSLTELGVNLAGTCLVTAPVSVARARFLENPAQEPLVLHDPSGAPVGVFARTELQACLEADGEQTTEHFMDRRFVTLPVSVSVQHAAREALGNGARYVIAREGPASYRVLSGLTFAGCVFGGPTPSAKQSFVAPAPPATVSARDPGFQTGGLATILETLPSWTGRDAARPPPSDKPSLEPRRDEPSRKREPA